MSTATATATVTETRESTLLSKVDNAGNTHIYQRKTAGELLVGDHLLEHVIGHKPMVATPILAIVHTGDGVIVTIPDRHGSNEPVEELYPAEKSVFISKTPHLEQYDAEKNILVQQEKLMEIASVQKVEEVMSNPDDYQRALGVSRVYSSMDDQQVNRALQDTDWIVRMNVLIKAMDAGETDRVDDQVALTLMSDQKPEISMRAQRLFQDRDLSKGDASHFSQQQEGSVMEAGKEEKGKQFGAVEGAILGEDGKWRNLSAYVDKEGKMVGSLSVDGEKHKLEFAEKERDGKKSLGAVVKRENGHAGGSPDMYVRIAAVDGRSGRFASMSLSEKTPDGKWQGIQGKGGGLHMNDALLDGKGVHSKEAQFIEKTLDVGPGALIPVKAREKAVEQEQAVTAKSAPEKAEKAEKAEKVDCSREVVASQAPDQTVTLGEDPGNQRRWTGKIVSISEDRKSVDMQSAGKVSRVIDGQGKEFPAELKVGDYGKLLHSKTGPQFAAQEQQRSKAKEKSSGRGVQI
ncbi:hypothetical protein Acife_1940 [Acidithiobacillus ferrivorans SS3]|uniref:Uncharacterized protein n=1 Tax=Acidithiobacillus ferrivorans SS3 TaxID=743299 RepID=G0JLL4_9PROT|nr:hypothetical protein [Acidithiobacillus ferrivorans]AEM48063.1 hypothetical protein Acife_1940 [Acidithiobacillus ferrivorans SS3]